MILDLTMNYIFSCNNPCRSAGASKKNFRSSRIMADLPPWRALKAKATKLQMDNELSEQVEWRTPEFILIDKHLRFYKDYFCNFKVALVCGSYELPSPLTCLRKFKRDILRTVRSNRLLYGAAKAVAKTARALKGS